MAGKGRNDQSPDEPGPPIRIPRKQRVLAVVWVIIGATPMFFQPTQANALAMCGMWLLAWREAFYLSPSARLRLGQIHAAYRSGRYRQDHAGRWAAMFGVLLIVLSFALRLKQG